MLVAIPEFRHRVSPTFDYCHKVTLWRLDERGFTKVEERRCSSFGPAQRAAALQAMGVRTLLCGIIGLSLEQDIRSRKIEVISGLSGDVLEVMAAFASHCLDRPKFQVPGAPQRFGRKG